MNDDYEIRILAQAAAIQESLRPDTLKLEDMIRLRRSLASDALDLEVKRKIRQYVEHLQYAQQSLEDLLKYLRSY